MARCIGCAELNELYQRTPKSDRDYWLWTEAFVGIHGCDVCRCTGPAILSGFMAGSGQEAGRNGPDPVTEADTVSE
jgi:hypothetical protein